MSRRSKRISLGGAGLRDSSSFHNTRSSSAPRRMSFGAKTHSLVSESNVDEIEPKKDRRVMLAEWRKQVRATRDPPQSSTAHDSSSEAIKRQGNGYDYSSTQGLPLPLPPTREKVTDTIINNTIRMEGTTAVERFRLRRQQRQLQAGTDEKNTPILPPQPPSSAKKRSSICFDDEDDDTYQEGGIDLNNASCTGISITGSPFKRRMSLSGGAKRRSDRRRRTIVPTKPNDIKTLQEIAPLPVAKLDVCIDDGATKGPGLQSRIVLMEKRIQQLEKEKMALSMSKAPLEARLRQKEDEWMKETIKYEQEMLSLKNCSKDADEKHKSLEMQFEALQEKSNQLLYDARKFKAATNLESDCQGSSDIWNRQLQNDRDITDLKVKIKHQEDEIRSLRLEKVSIETEINATNLELSGLMRDFDNLQVEYDELKAEKEANSDAGIQLQELSKEHTATTAQLNATSAEFASLKSQSRFEMEVQEQKWQEEKEKLLFDMSVLKSRAAIGNITENLEINKIIEDEVILRARVEERDRRITELESQVLKGEQMRRKMHNHMQELRGNIRVFVRTRPFLPEDGTNSSSSSIDVLPSGEELSIIDPRKQEKIEFKFDKVFSASTGQDSVFDEVSEFVQSALDGYNVCLFSYGQTGSGKTHTMQGSGNGAMRGIIPRAVEQILSQAKSMQSQKWKFNMTASFLEIYNETLRDLLVSLKPVKPSMINSTCKQSKLSIKRDSSGKKYVEGLTKMPINTVDFQAGIETLKEAMATAARNRSVATTKMNAQSSRSHSVFMLHLHGVNEESGTVVSGALNLCDLAGSERLDRSGAGSNARRLKETQSINKSLSCLGDVFNSLASGASHIPFRNSKLTFLLQDCLSGDGKALMFVNLSPTIDSSHESLCSLRYAERVNQVELGKATKHVQYVGRNTRSKHK